MSPGEPNEKQMAAARYADYLQHQRLCDVGFHTNHRDGGERGVFPERYLHQPDLANPMDTS